MTRRHTSFILGYHGCDRDIGEMALAGELRLLKSEKSYDWLGAGIYFGESDPLRALEWAQARRKRGTIKDPFVIGAAIDLANCLDLTLRENLELLRAAYVCWMPWMGSRWAAHSDPAASHGVGQLGLPAAGRHASLIAHYSNIASARNDESLAYPQLARIGSHRAGH